MRSNLQSTTSTERPLTQAERTAASDRAMLAAAIDLIIEKGIEKTTLVANSWSPNWSPKYFLKTLLP